MIEPVESMSTQGKIFVNGILSTQNKGKIIDITGNCLGLNQDKSLFVEFFKGTRVVAGTWVIEVVNYQSGHTDFFHEIYLDGEEYFVPDKNISFGVG